MALTSSAASLIEGPQLQMRVKIGSPMLGMRLLLQSFTEENNV